MILSPWPRKSRPSLSLSLCLSLSLSLCLKSHRSPIEHVLSPRCCSHVVIDVIDAAFHTEPLRFSIVSRIFHTVFSYICPLDFRDNPNLFNVQFPTKLRHQDVSYSINWFQFRLLPTWSSTGHFFLREFISKPDIIGFFGSFFRWCTSSTFHCIHSNCMSAWRVKGPFYLNPGSAKLSIIFCIFSQFRKWEICAACFPAAPI